MAAIGAKVQSGRRGTRRHRSPAINGRLTLLEHKADMVEKNDSKRSDWRAIGGALLQIGAVFVPIALCMLVLAGLSAHVPPQGVDAVQTGSIDRR